MNDAVTVDPCYATRIPVFLFVGERRSLKAIAHGWTWAHNRLAGKTLNDTLEQCGISRVGRPYASYYDVVNAWHDTGEENADVLGRIQQDARHGWTIVALGKKVAKFLAAHGIPHQTIRHPAARGTGRKTAVYRAHVAEVLGLTLQENLTEQSYP